LTTGGYINRVGIILLVLAFATGLVACPGNGTDTSRYLEIRTWHDLDDIRQNLGLNYVLMSDLDSTTAGYADLASVTANGGQGWEPIGTALFDLSDPDSPYVRVDPFTGVFEGQGFEIRDLFINRPDEQAVGLFRAVDGGGVIRNVGTADLTVTGGTGVGGLVGVTGNEGIVTKAYSTGIVIGNTAVGGLVGGNAYEGSVTNSYSKCSVTGEIVVGGLVGHNKGTVSNSYAAGPATGDMGVGGLVGLNLGGSSVMNSYAAGAVTCNWLVGGLVGGNDGGSVSNSFWDVETSGQASSDGGAGKTTAEMRSIATFTAVAWDVCGVATGRTDQACTWNIIDGQTYAFLSWQSTP